MCHIVFILPVLALPLFIFLPVGQASIYYGSIVIACGIVYWLMIRDMRRSPSTGMEGMIGTMGTVIGKTRDGVKVFLRGEIWDADCEEEVSEGEAVEVASLEGMRLIVKKRSRAGGHPIKS